MLPQQALNLGPQPLGSNALLSEPLRHGLLGRSKICIWSCCIGSNSMVKVHDRSGAGTKYNTVVKLLMPI